MRPFLVSLCCLASLSITLGGGAPDGAPLVDRPVDAERREAIVNRIVATFHEFYIHPEGAQKLETALRARNTRGDYDHVETVGELTTRLTAELREITDDLHVLILPYEELPAYRFEDRLVGTPYDNFGFRRVERLPGNIGYLEFVRFYNTREAGQTAVAAMGFLANCDALIIDLRLNGGGDTTMGQLLASYFFDEAKLLNRFYTRHNDTTQEIWTSNFVSGSRMTDVPIYILLGRHSFSAAESFAYELKHIDRATLVGEQTLGGGHSVTYKSYPQDWINIRVPIARDIHPITGTGFQGVGVEPHVKSTARDAYATANALALRELLTKGTDPERRYELEWALQEYEAALEPAQVEADALQACVGEYGPRRVTFDGEKLFYSHSGVPPRPLLPLGDDLFTFETERSYSHYRIWFVRDDVGHVIGLRLTGDDGDPPTPVYPRTAK